MSRGALLHHGHFPLCPLTVAPTLIPWVESGRENKHDLARKRRRGEGWSRGGAAAAPAWGRDTAGAGFNGANGFWQHPHAWHRFVFLQPPPWQWHLCKAHQPPYLVLLDDM